METVPQTVYSHDILFIHHFDTGTVAREGLTSADYARIVTRAKFRTVLARIATDPEHVVADVQLLADMIAPPPLPAGVCRDPDDDNVLALAVAARVDFIVSGDDDLLVLGTVADIPILTPTQKVLTLGAKLSAGFCAGEYNAKAHCTLRLLGQDRGTMMVFGVNGQGDKLSRIQATLSERAVSMEVVQFQSELHPTLAQLATRTAFSNGFTD